MPNFLKDTRKLSASATQGGVDRAGMNQGRIWPNGSFGFGKKRSEGYGYRKELDDTIDVWVETGVRTLPLSVPSNSHSHIKKKRDPRGTKGITSYGRKMVENTAFLMDRDYGRKRLSFGTLTLPRVDQIEGWLISTDWANIVRRFFQRLSRRLARRGLPRDYVYVTEMQGLRSEREGHPALHLHFVFVGKHEGGTWLISTDEVVEMWSDCLKKFLPGERYFRKTKVLEPIKKSVEGYLGKYMSKGGDVSAWQPPEEFIYKLPSSWWGMSGTLRRAVKDAVIKASSALEFIERAMHSEESQGMFKFWGAIDRVGPMGRYVLGFCGKIHPDSLGEVWEICQQL